jgi:hypothetical protein
MARGVAAEKDLQKYKDTFPQDGLIPMIGWTDLVCKASWCTASTAVGKDCTTEDDLKDAIAKHKSLETLMASWISACEVAAAFGH